MYEDDDDDLNRPLAFERTVANNCPASADLILAALGHKHPSTDEAPAARVSRHVGNCDECGARLTELLEVVRTLRTEAPERPPGNGCLDPHDLALLVDSASTAVDQRAVAHLASCAGCRAQLAAALHLVRDTAVAGEIERLESTPRIAAHRRSRFAIAGSLAAAMLAGVLLWPWTGGRLELTPVPEDARDERQITSAEARGAAPAEPTASTDSPLRSRAQSAERYRERTITTTAAPRILAPVGSATNADSLVWTSVPGADLYRITFWRADGTEAWKGEARDTMLALPAPLSQSGVGPLLWEVRARTGWDRWVVSELVEVVLHMNGGGIVR